MLRVAAGAFKGLSLVSPPGIRATSSKVRMALFNILGSSVEGARVVDAYAGSGALGIEALSRGAAFAAFIDADAEAVLSIRDNLSRLGRDLPREAWRVMHLEAARAFRHLAAEQPLFDLVICDPPYRDDEAKKALNAVGECAMLAPSGLVVVEHEQRTILPESAGHLRQWKRHRYGDTVLSFYARHLPRHL